MSAFSLQESKDGITHLVFDLKESKVNILSSERISEKGIAFPEQVKSSAIIQP